MKQRGREQASLIFHFLSFFVFAFNCIPYTQCNYHFLKISLLSWTILQHETQVWCNRCVLLGNYHQVSFLSEKKKKHFFHNDTDEFCCFTSNTLTQFKSLVCIKFLNYALKRWNSLSQTLFWIHTKYTAARSPRGRHPAILLPPASAPASLRSHQPPLLPASPPASLCPWALHTRLSGSKPTHKLLCPFADFAHSHSFFFLI